MNIFRFSVMLTAGEFVIYVLKFLNKYLPGSIYLNFYFDGLAGIFAYMIGAPFYKYFGIRNAFIVSISGTLVFVTFFFLLRIEAIPPYLFVYFGA